MQRFTAAILRRLVLFASVSALLVVATAAMASAPAGADAGTSEAVPAEAAPHDTWWAQLHALCGKAYAGTLVSNDPADAALAGQLMVMHVRRCTPDRLEIPFHIGENRSRTWVLTRTAGGIRLQHDHRHEDGSEDDVTLYGGATEGPGTTEAQHFPADDYSKALFARHGLEASVVNVWTMEVVPGERFAYVLRRPGRHFQADFDLRQPVEVPPAPWGHDE